MNVDGLIYLHKYGRIFTENGQSHLCEYNIHYPKTKHVYMNIDDGTKFSNIIDESYGSMEQRSYLQGYIEKKILKKLISFLNNFSEICYSFYVISSKKTFSNFNEHTWATRTSEGKNNENWEEFTSIDPEHYTQTYNKCFTTISDLVEFKILNINQCKGPNIEDLLINFIKKKRSKKRRSRSNKRSRSRSISKRLHN